MIWRLILLVLMAGIVGGCSNRSNAPQKWGLIFQNDYNGRPVYGSVSDLIEEMKRGTPIRVAWGGKEPDGSTWVEFAEPDFTTIMNDSVVMVQFPLSLIQTHYTDANKSFLNTDRPTGWRALMGTTGRYHQFHYDFVTLQLVRIMYCRTTVSWFALRNATDPDTPSLTPEDAFLVDSVTYPTPSKEALH